MAERRLTDREVDRIGRRYRRELERKRTEHATLLWRVGAVAGAVEGLVFFGTVGLLDLWEAPWLPWVLVALILATVWHTALPLGRPGEARLAARNVTASPF